MALDVTTGEQHQQPAAMAEALEAQTGIGWRNFLLGRTAKQLEEWQQRHFDKTGSRNTGRRWAIELAKKLMGVCWDMWQHRNDVLHNDGQNFQRKVELAKADASIREEHAKGKDTLLKSDKFLPQVPEDNSAHGIERKTNMAGLHFGGQGGLDCKTERDANFRRRASEDAGVGDWSRPTTPDHPHS